MSVSQLLDTTFALYRQNFALFAGIVAVLYAPLTLFQLAFTFSAPLGSLKTTTAPDGSVTFPPDFFPNLETTLALFGGLVFVTLIFTALITGALAQAISARYLNRPMTVGEAYRSVGMGTFVSLVVASVLSTICVFVGFFAVIIGALYLYVRFIFISQSLVLEHSGIIGAFRRSGYLVRGSWWRVFGTSVVLFIFVAIVGGVASAVGGIFGAFTPYETSTVVKTIVSSAANVFALPIQLGTLTLLYYDLRIRKEGFDLEQMVQAMGGEALHDDGVWIG
jgi:hypothetical protein